jgi:WhiB family transcriptional regulator, redox-sensing transcriptional regulator
MELGNARGRAARLTRDAAVSKPERNAPETMGGDALVFMFPHLVEAGWRSAAACRLSDPDLFFPVSSAGIAQREIAEALAVCARCPVRAPCREFALRTRQQHGIWGGTTEHERRQLWRPGTR